LIIRCVPSSHLWRRGEKIARNFNILRRDPDSALLPVALRRFFASLKPGGAERWRNRHNR
jgi:hypothetical protein